MSTERDNALFRALVEREIAESSAEIREMFARDPQREREWEETKELLAALDESSRVRREVLARAATAPEAPGAEGAERTLREAMARASASAAELRGSGGDNRASVPPSDSNDSALAGEARAGSRRQTWLWFAAAASVILCALLVRHWKSSTDDAHGSLLLGEFELEPQTTGDAASGSLRFEWRGKTAPDARFILTIQGRMLESEDWREVQGSGQNSSTTTWSPGKERIASWPHFLRWRVIAINPTSGFLEAQSPWCYVSLPR